MIGFLTAALVAGLVGSPHCIGMCGGFAVLCGGRVTDVAAWHMGCLTLYAGLGALVLGCGPVGLSAIAFVPASVKRSVRSWTLPAKKPLVRMRVSRNG